MISEEVMLREGNLGSCSVSMTVRLRIVSSMFRKPLVRDGAITPGPSLSADSISGLTCSISCQPGQMLQMATWLAKVTHMRSGDSSYDEAFSTQLAKTSL